MATLEFEKQETSEFDFFNFEKEGDSFTGTFIKEHDGVNTEPKDITGFMFKDLNGNKVMLPDYYKIAEFIKEKAAEGIDCTKRIMKIEFEKTIEIKGGKTMKRFNFYLAKLPNAPETTVNETEAKETETNETEAQDVSFSARRNSKKK